MISLKPIRIVGSTTPVNLERVYFYVPTSITFTLNNTTNFVIFSLGGGLSFVTPTATPIEAKNQTIIACGGGDIYLDSYSLNIGVNNPNYANGLQVNSTFKIYRNGTLVVTQPLVTNLKAPYTNSFAPDLLFSYEDTIAFSFQLSSVPPASSIYLNLIAAFSYAV